MGKINIHELWSFADKINKETGETEEHGLFPILGIEGTARELKKRCESEVKYAEKPFAGCAYYTLLILHWVNLCISGEDAADIATRKLFEKHLLAAGEKEIADLIEYTWKPYKEHDELPADIQYDARDEARDILEDRYGEIAYSPEHLSPAEIRKSKEIALSLGKRKRPKKPDEEIAETVPEEGKSPDKSLEKPDIRAEIEENIQRAR